MRSGKITRKGAAILMSSGCSRILCCFQSFSAMFSLDTGACKVNGLGLIIWRFIWTREGNELLLRNIGGKEIPHQQYWTVCSWLLLVLDLWLSARSQFSVVRVCMGAGWGVFVRNGLSVREHIRGGRLHTAWDFLLLHTRPISSGIRNCVHILWLLWLPLP